MLATNLRVRALAAVSTCALGAGTAGAADAIAHATARPATAHADQSVTFQVKQVLGGMRLRQWDIKGKCDGLTADAKTLRIIATVNEVANSSLYLIRPFGRRAGQVQHYRYARRLPHRGGTDAISIYHGMVLISASAPGTTGKKAPQPSYPAVYRVTFDRASRNNAPATCPAPGFPANYLGVLDPRTGDITAAQVSGATLEPQGMIFVPHPE